MNIRIYLDFDGVISPTMPDVKHGLMIAVAGDCISLDSLNTLKKSIHTGGFETVWATHREESVYDITDQLGLPRLPHLTFTDPTGSKVKDIIAHYTANPCSYAMVHEDSLTAAEIEALTEAGLAVRMFDNCVIQSRYEPEDK